MKEIWFTQMEFLNYLKVKFKISRSPVWARSIRYKGEGPKYLKLGGAVRYRQDWVDEWVEGEVCGGNCL